MGDFIGRTSGTYVRTFDKKSILIFWALQKGSITGLLERSSGLDLGTLNHKFH